MGSAHIMPANTSIGNMPGTILGCVRQAHPFLEDSLMDKNGQRIVRYRVNACNTAQGIGQMQKTSRTVEIHFTPAFE